MRTTDEAFSVVRDNQGPRITLQCSCLWEGPRYVDYVSDREVLDLALKQVGGDVPAIQKEEEMEIANFGESVMVYDMRVPLTARNVLGMLLAGYKRDALATAECAALMPSDGELAEMLPIFDAWVEDLARSRRQGREPMFAPARECRWRESRKHGSPQSPSPGHSQTDALLRSHLAEGRDYRVFIGVPVNAPAQWQEAKVAGQPESRNELIQQDTSGVRGKPHP